MKRKQKTHKPLVPNNMQDGEFKEARIKLTILRANVSSSIKIIHLLPDQ